MHAHLKLALAMAALPFAACTATAPGSSDSNTLVAAKAGAAPLLDGIADDAVWKSAKALTFKVSGGNNFGGTGETTVTMRSVTAGDSIYFLIQYADPTESLRRGPFQKQADGSWKKLKDPADKGGDDNVFYEDKWAIIWNIGDSIAGFNENGCAVLCHAGEEGKPFGNKYTAKPGELGDMWHHKGSRNGVFGFVDDQYVDDTRFDAQKSPNAGRKGDPGGPDYKAFNLANGKPEFMAKAQKPANKGGAYFIRDGEQVPFVDTFAAGDEVPSYVVFPLKADRADIKVAYRWQDGKYTYEVSRKLVTGSRFDVQFDDASRPYYFGFAAFDNAQVRHAMSGEPFRLVLAK
jgi:ethylbenzene dehydrogenase